MLKIEMNKEKIKSIFENVKLGIIEKKPRYIGGMILLISMLLLLSCGGSSSNGYEGVYVIDKSTLDQVHLKRFVKKEAENKNMSITIGSDYFEESFYGNRVEGEWSEEVNQDNSVSLRLHYTSKKGKDKTMKLIIVDNKYIMDKSLGKSARFVKQEL